jgi:hypothetical protein
MEVRIVDIINMKVSLMEVDEENLEEEEVVEVVLEVINDAFLSPLLNPLEGSTM